MGRVTERVVTARGVAATAGWVGLFLWALPAVAQQASVPSLTVSGSVERPLNLTAPELAALPRASVTVTRSGISIRYEGVWVHELLRLAGAPLGEQLRGPALASYVRMTAADGYEVVFSLVELDPAFVDGQVLLADSADGRPLPGDDGPFRIVTPREARPARSIRMLTSIEVVRLSR